MSRRAIPARRGRAAAESSGAEAQALLARTARQQERVEELELELAQSKVPLAHTSPIPRPHLAHTSPIPRPCTSPPHLPHISPHLPTSTHIYPHLPHISPTSPHISGDDLRDERPALRPLVRRRPDRHPRLHRLPGTPLPARRAYWPLSSAELRPISAELRAPVSILRISTSHSYLTQLHLVL